MKSKKVIRIKYIDGLRALAIIAVFFYNSITKSFPNAYLGVDYFLVIIPFLISKKYFVEIEENFSFKEFWSKKNYLFVNPINNVN